MADISKCCNNKCPKREECYRYRVKPNPYRQAYSEFKPEMNCFKKIDSGWAEQWFIPKGRVVKNIFEKEGEL